ncbi:glycoside hydrolase family protein [Cryptosporangium minutisporangium]|uniref:Glycoside hydrolase family protein n=1 Tax=Cryptosporangium minutisporangium TaxID=113569 RepID=A0ABP6SUP8_9ACTN
MPRSRRRVVLIVALCLGVLVAAVGTRGWVLGGRGGDRAPVAAVIGDASDPATPASTASTARPRVSVGPAQSGVGASPSPRASRTVGGARPVSSKKGAALNPFGAVRSALADARVGWYYNWAADPQGIAAPPGVAFTPMIWGADSVNAATLDAVRQRGDTLLGFNEPDFASQSNLSVDRALALWPQLMATGMRLGSPAPATGGATDGSWFDQFMKGAQSKGYRVDFIALHWYGGDFTTANAVGQLKSYLQTVHDRWRKPIWLTEYALIDFSAGVRFPTPEQQAAFVTASTAMLDSLSYVERYSWFLFSPPRDGGGSGTSLYTAAGTPTRLGTAYRAAG